MIRQFSYILGIISVLLVVLSSFSESRSQSRIDDVKTFSSVPYSSRPGLNSDLNKLDIYAPKDAKNAPVMIMIHGGGWQMGDKSNRAVWENKVPFFSANGFIFVNINYRLSPSIRHPEHIRDVAEALSWVHNNIEKYSGDKNKIFVMGHSAGAHLAALVSTDEQRLKEFNKGLSIIKGVILLDGAGYDIPQQIKRLSLVKRRMAVGEVLAEMYEDAFTANEAVQKEASPFYHIEKGKNIPPFLIFTAGGRADSVDQSRKMVQALDNARIRAETVDDPAKNHGTINRNFGLADEMITKKSKAFLDSILKL